MSCPTTFPECEVESIQPVSCVKLLNRYFNAMSKAGNTSNMADVGLVKSWSNIGSSLEGHLNWDHLQSRDILLDSILDLDTGWNGEELAKWTVRKNGPCKMGHWLSRQLKLLNIRPLESISTRNSRDGQVEIIIPLVWVILVRFSNVEPGIGRNDGMTSWSRGAGGWRPWWCCSGIHWRCHSMHLWGASSQWLSPLLCCWGHPGRTGDWELGW